MLHLQYPVAENPRTLVLKIRQIYLVQPSGHRAGHDGQLHNEEDGQGKTLKNKDPFADNVH